MKRIKWKSMLAFVLTCMIVISAVPVTQVNASGEVSGNSVSGNEIEVPPAEAGDQDEDTDNTDNDSKQDLQEPLNSGTESEGEAGQETGADDGIATTSVDDITPPVIESDSIVFLENGQEIIPGNDIHITFTGYDVDSELSTEYTNIQISIGDTGRATGWKPYSIEAVDTSNNAYKLSFKIESYYEPGEMKIDKLTVGDSSWNITEIDLSSYDESGCPKFTIAEIVNESITINSISLSANKVVLDDDTLQDAIGIEMNVTGEGMEGGGSFCLEFECEYTDEYGSVSTRSNNVYMYAYWPTEKITGTISVEASTHYAATYILKKVTYAGEKVAFEGNVEYTVEINYTDVDDPVVEYVEFYHNGVIVDTNSTFKQTDELDIHVGITDASEISTAYVHFEYHMENLSAPTKSVYLEYDSDLECYVGSLSLSDMYATEWGIGKVHAEDIYNNRVESRDYNDFIFYVTDAEGNTTIPTYTYDVYFEMEDGSQSSYSVTTTRCTSLKEMFPNGMPYFPAKDGFEFVGWYLDGNEADRCVTEEEEFIIDGRSITIYPVYDKRELEIYVSYLSQDGSSVNEYRDIVIAEGATYRDLCEYLKAEIQHYEGMEFNGWKLDKDLDQVIPRNASYISCYADYNKVLVKASLNYTSQDGDSYDSRELFVDKDTTYSELCEIMKEWEVDHHTELGFERWKLPEEYNDKMDQVITTGFSANINASAEYAKIAVNVNVFYLAEEGYFKSVNRVIIADRESTYGNIIGQINFSEFVHYDGVTFKEWKLEDESAVNPEEVISEDNSYVKFTAEYEEKPVEANYIYYDENRDYFYTGRIFICEKGITYRELMEKLNLNELLHAKEFGFTGEWKLLNSSVGLNDVVEENAVTFEAQYAEKNIVTLYYYYYNKQDQYYSFYKGIVYEDGATYKDILEKYLISDDKHKDGFTGWEYYYPGNSLEDVITEKSTISCYPIYEDTGDGGNTGESGDNGNTGGNENSGSGNTDNAGNAGSDNTGNSGSVGGAGNIENSGSSDSTDTSIGTTIVTKPKETVEETTIVEIPQLRQESTVPEFPTLSADEESIEEKSAVKLEEEVIGQKVEEVQKAEEGVTLVIEMTREDGEVATEVPVAVLEAVKGRDVTIVLDMGGYSWTIHGQDVVAGDLSAINLEVTMDTEAVAPSIVEKLAGGEPTRQISLTHDGDFGFKASLTINVGIEHKDEFGNLYYHDSNGKLVFMNAGQIDAEGNVSLDFSHASDYVVVVGRDRTEEETQKIEESMPAEILSEEVVPVEEEVETTGNGLIPAVIVLIVIAAVAGVVLAKKNKKS